MFVLRIPVTRSHLDALKGGLTKVLPDVKSSHRVEALGRGLGFRTYAALRAAAISPNMASRSIPPISIAQPPKSRSMASSTKCRDFRSTVSVCGDLNAIKTRPGRPLSKVTRNSLNGGRNVRDCMRPKNFCWLWHCYLASNRPRPSRQAAEAIG